MGSTARTRTHRHPPTTAVCAHWRDTAGVASIAPQLPLTAGTPLGPLPTFLPLPAGTPSSQLFPAEAGEPQPGLIQSISGVMSYESADSIKGDCQGRQSPAADGERSPLPSERIHLCHRVPALCSLKEPTRHKSSRGPAGRWRCTRARQIGGETEARHRERFIAPIEGFGGQKRSPSSPSAACNLTCG